jgi:hypothetical protein
LDGLNLMDIDGLRLSSHLDVKLLSVAGFNRTRNLTSVLQGDDIGEKPTTGQQAKLQDNGESSSHIQLLLF